MKFARFPDFFIVGAPKCGTTSLYHYLSLHHSIYMPDQKEPCYYCADLPSVRKTADLSIYLRNFEDAPLEAKWGEATPWYLRSKDAAQLILKDNPNARLIACIRNPVDMFVSYHNQLIFNLTETIADPEKAWRAQSARRPQTSGDVRVNDTFQLMYGEMCSLGAQAKHLIDVAGADKVRFVLFEDISGRARETYSSLLAFLGIPDDGRQDFPAYNQRRVHKFPQITRFLKNPPPPLSYAKAALKKMVGSPSASSKRFYDLMTRTTDKPVLRPEFRAELKDFFADDVEFLEKITGRDLSAWRA